MTTSEKTSLLLIRAGVPVPKLDQGQVWHKIGINKGPLLVVKKKGSGCSAIEIGKDVSTLLFLNTNEKSVPAYTAEKLMDFAASFCTITLEKGGVASPERGASPYYNKDGWWARMGLEQFDCFDENAAEAVAKVILLMKNKAYEK